ncbi:hypothetical protein K2F54_17095 [Cryobacterium sp. 1639]|uniref:hypothetical protein n=1 Tax=Cryobacterium inferilacus TaxID=2866629 RepID=UPI001C73305C|nr:hypothetical protein [Cryobacterium sp. 1639]MBX0301688.1 hypothetical protein [Cryobacterium sp. 1639]
MSGPGGTEGPTFDPRHDPRFQRGYRPGDALPDRGTPAASATPTTPAAPVADQPVTNTDVDATDDFDTLLFDGDTFADEPESSRWNPFITLLWVLGVVLPTGGITLQWQAVNNMFGSSSYDGTGDAPMSVVMQQFSYLVAPSLITAGLFILAGLLFWHAAAWRARRRGVTG